METKCPAQCFDAPANVRRHFTEEIGTDMRLGQITDFLRRPGRNHRFQTNAMTLIFRSGSQFPIGKHAGAAFPEFDIAVFL